MRLVARHLVRHLPGHPTPVPRNMTGATGLVMANYLYKVAPQDGTFIGLIQNGLPTFQAVGMEGVQFDAQKFNWIGSPTQTNDTLLTWHASGVKTIEQARKRETIIGSIGASGITFMYPSMLNDMAGTRFRIVPGYRGAGELNIAMQRGEIEGRVNSWNSIRASHLDWIKNGDAFILVYSGSRQKELANVPHFDEVVKSEDDRKVAQIVTTGSRLGYPFAVGPGVPKERVEAIRKAFVAMLNDKEFIKEATSLKMDVDPVPASELQEIVGNLFASPDAVRARARTYFERDKK